MAATQDLTMRMIPFLDRHLVFPLIEFLELKEVNFSFTRRYKHEMKLNIRSFFFLGLCS